MSMEPSNEAPKAEAPILVFSGRPDRLNQLRAEIFASSMAEQFNRIFVFDGVQAYRLFDAKAALAQGHGGRGHKLLLLDGDVAATLRQEQVETLKSASLEGWKLIVMGLADSNEERAKLSALGIKRICAPLTFSSDFRVQWKAAINDFEAEMAELLARQTRAAAPAVIVEVERNPSSGLLPDGGIIAVHASKGGAGKTMIATNIAYALSTTGKSTVLADLNPDGAAAHLHFMKWIKKQEQVEDPWELFEYKGLTLLARKLEHRQEFTMRPEQLEEVLVRVTDSLSLLPGISDQSDYGVGTDSDRTVSKLLNTRKWADNLIDMLSARVGGSRYVVIDTGTSRYTTPGFVTVTRADLLVIVVNAATHSNVSVEVSAWKRLLDPERGHSYPMRGQRMLVINQLGNMPGSPRFEDVVRQFAFLEPTVVLPVRSDLASLLSADTRGMPLLADPNLVAGSSAGADLVAVVNAIAGIIKVKGADDKKRGRLFGRRQKG